MDFFTIRTQRCTNCGLTGHLFRNCTLPVTSYGIIAFRYTNNSHNASLFSKSIMIQNGYESIQILLIKRKNSISYFEFMRGKYNQNDDDYICYLLRNMTQEEQDNILTIPFSDLWKKMWDESVMSHKNNYDSSEKKYQSIQPKLEKWIAENRSKWKEPEWGFPKGRRNPCESDINCAIREFQEETDIKRSEFSIIQNTHYISETFYGSNQTRYSHKYYLAVCNPSVQIELNADNRHMAREIGDIQWFSLEEAISKIRPDNIEKREILLKAGKIMKNFHPLSTMDHSRIIIK